MDTNIEMLHKDLSYKIIGLAMQVHSELGFGFLEKVYENSMMILFSQENITAKRRDLNTKGLFCSYETIRDNSC
jgi:GxxExxY protein